MIIYEKSEGNESHALFTVTKELNKLGLKKKDPMKKIIRTRVGVYTVLMIIGCDVEDDSA